MEENANTTSTTSEPTEQEIAAAVDTAIDTAVSETIATDADEGAVHSEAVAESDAQPSAEDAPKSEANAEAGAGKDNADADYSEEQALFDRALRAGMSVKDVLSIPTRDMAERMVEIAEKANGISKPDKGDDYVDAGTPVDEMATALKEMDDDGGYDPKIMRLLKGLYAENAKLKEAGKTAAQESFFDQQFGSLDESLRAKVDAMHKSQLKSKFDILEAGYRAQGSRIQRQDIFQEAARLALGDLMGKVAEERKAAALAKRKDIRLARPRGENGQFRVQGPATEEDIASEIWDMINN